MKRAAEMTPLDKKTKTRRISESEEIREVEIILELATLDLDDQHNRNDSTVVSWKAVKYKERLIVKSRGVKTNLNFLDVQDVDTTQWSFVLEKLLFVDGKFEQKPGLDQQDLTSSQRKALLAFKSDFANSVGRNFIYAILDSYLAMLSANLDIFNVGGGSLKNPLLHTLGLVFNYAYSQNTSPVCSSKKPCLDTLSDTAPSDSSTSSLSDYDECHTPVVDILVYDAMKNKAILTVEVKGRTLLPSDEHQVKLQMMSLLPTDKNVTGKLGGILISQHEAIIYMTEKQKSNIVIYELKSYDFRSPDFVSIFCLFITHMVNLSKFCLESA